MDMFLLLFLTIIGALFIFVGLLIWKKQMINLVHSYHYTNVKQSDKRAYTKLMGIGTILIGAGIVITEIIEQFAINGYGWFAFIAAFIAGIAVILQAQYKYNGGLF